MARSLKAVRYVPLLELRPAEMFALQSLPEKDKDAMFPMFRLGPWVGAHQLSSAIARIKEAYGDRPCYVAFGEYEPSNPPRPVHGQLDALKAPSHGYAAWCEFFEDDNNESFVPAAQLLQPTEFEQQVARLHALGRGLAIPIEAGAIPFAGAIAARAATHTSGGRDLLFVLDYGRQNQSFLGRVQEVAGVVSQVLQAAPNARVSFSASSFPDSFTAITQQEIFERHLFSALAPMFSGQVVYSDRGSARAERQSGGGGAPAPRIDYAAPSSWHFFRSDAAGDRSIAYQDQAQRLMASPVWDGNLRVWGTQMIERTALGDQSAITSPNRSTAARINIHLHQQLWFGDQDALYDTDEEWSD